MNRRMVVDRITQSILVGLAASALGATALAGPGPSGPGAMITAYADRYIVGDLAFDDLDQLESHVTATNARHIEVLMCGDDATRALKAVVHRFRQLPVQMRVLDAAEFECKSRAPLGTPVQQRVGQRPFGIDDEAVERYWLGMMP